MDSFELNKVAGAVLGTLLFAMGTGFVAELIYHPRPAGKAGYELPEPEPVSPTAEAAPKAEPIAVRLASANVEKGQAGTKACQACHSFEKGGPNKVGPDLYGVVERPKGSHAGFDYSAGMKEKGGGWSYADLDAFLESPKAYVKGTKMAFAGISAPQARANVIAWLRTLDESPQPLPAAEKHAEAEKAVAKPADVKPNAAEPAATKPADTKPADTKPADAKPTSEKTPADTPAPERPTATPPAATPSAKPAEAKPSNSMPAANGDNARKVPAPEIQPQQNEAAPTQAPVAKPSGDIDTSAPSAPSEAPVTQGPAKADPAAEEKAQDLTVGKNKPAPK